MPQAAAAQRPIAMGDIVRFEGEDWTVLATAEEPGINDTGPAITLRLERAELVPVAVPLGQRPRYKTVRRHQTAAAGRCRLLASQEAMFGAAIPDAAAAPSDGDPRPTWTR